MKRLDVRFAVVALSIALVALPAFAANGEVAQPEKPAGSFHAWSGIAADDQAAPTLLTDQQLALVKGGFDRELTHSLPHLAISYAQSNNIVAAEFLQDAAV